MKQTGKDILFSGTFGKDNPASVLLECYKRERKEILVSTTRWLGPLKMAGSIIVLVAIGCLLVACGDTGSKQDQTLEDQMASCQAQLTSLERLLEEIRQTNLAQWAGLQSRIEQIRIDYLSQATTIESRFNQTAEDSSARIDALESQLSDVREEWLQQVTNLETQLEELHTAGLETSEEQAAGDPGDKPAPSPRIAYINAEDAFTVFILAVGDLRQQITDKNNEISNLQNEYAQGIIARDDYERRIYELNAELLDARVTTASGTLDRMIASSAFSDLRSTLITLREEAQPLIDEVNNLVSTIRVGAIDATEFQNRYTALSTMFEQFDGYVTSAATTKLARATEKVANEYGYDIVIRMKDIIMYRNPATIDDITELVKAEIKDYL